MHFTHINALPEIRTAQPPTPRMVLIKESFQNSFASRPAARWNKEQWRFPEIVLRRLVVGARSDVSSFSLHSAFLDIYCAGLWLEVYLPAVLWMHWPLCHAL